MFVPGKLFYPILTNALAYYENPYITDKKVLYHWIWRFRQQTKLSKLQGLSSTKGWANTIKLFTFTVTSIVKQVSLLLAISSQILD